MEIAPRLLVIAEVSEDPGFEVKRIRPVGIIHAGCQNEHVQSAFYLAPVSKAALTVDAHESGERIIASIAPAPSLINCIDYQIRGDKCV